MARLWSEFKCKILSTRYYVLPVEFYAILELVIAGLHLLCRVHRCIIFLGGPSLSPCCLFCCQCSYVFACCLYISDYSFVLIESIYSTKCVGRHIIINTEAEFTAEYNYCCVCRYLTGVIMSAVI